MTREEFNVRMQDLKLAYVQERTALEEEIVQKQQDKKNLCQKFAVIQQAIMDLNEGVRELNVRISCRKAEFLEEKRQLLKEYEYDRDRHLPACD